MAQTMNWDNYTEKDLEALERMGHLSNNLSSASSTRSNNITENRRGRPFRGNNVAYKWRKHLGPFDVWRFVCPERHVQRFHHDEIVGELSCPRSGEHQEFHRIPARNALLTIPVFVKGTFRIDRKGQRPILASALDGTTFDYIDVEHGDDVSFTAMHEGATFDCICPKDKTAYYRRRVLREPGNRLDRECWVYDPQAVTMTRAQAGSIVGVGVVVLWLP
jgi:hypothetical protein